jgi:hypothetical protein
MIRDDETRPVSNSSQDFSAVVAQFTMADGVAVRNSKHQDPP